MSKTVCAMALMSALVAVSCSAAADVTTTSTIDTPSTSTTVGDTSTTSTTTTSTTTMSTTTTSTTTTTVALGSGSLEELEGQRQSGEFWHVGPGRYTVSVLPVELELSTDEEYSFVILSQSFVAFAEPGFLTFTRAPSLTVAELSGLAEPSVNDEVVRSDPPSVPFGDDAMVTAYLDATDPLVLLDTGTDRYLDTEVPWWEFTVDPAAGDGGFPCAFSSSCYNVVVQPDHGNFVVAPEWIFRLWRIETDDTTIWGFLQSPADRASEGITLANGILSGLSYG